MSQGTNVPPKIHSSESTYLELNPDPYFAFRKTPNCPELCHCYRLRCIYPVNTHLAAVTIFPLAVSKLTILLQKSKALNDTMGKILEGKLGSAQSLKTYGRC